MSTLTYNQLITKTFRDDAVRSVMMIDDDFFPYDELCNNFASIDDSKRVHITRAANIHKFFQNKSILCDVDKSVDHISIEKIRKSDLIILDYHLEYEDPVKSIDLINKLSHTEHMNIVVVYTSANLNNVWMEILVSLLGTNLKEMDLIDNPDTQQYWEDNVEDNLQEWLDRIEEDDLIEYMSSNKTTKRTNGTMCSQLKQHAKSIIPVLCEKKLKPLNLLSENKNSRHFLGHNKKNKWIQIGNVFVVLQNKTSADDSSQIWNSIDAALVDWSPTYYRLLISEIQNRLENEPISVAKNLEQDVEAQAAWLHQILEQQGDVNRELVIGQLFNHLADEIKRTLLESVKLRNTISNTIKSLAFNKDNSLDQELIFSAENHSLSHANINQLRLDIGHALNSSVCVYKFGFEFITNGTLLYDKNNLNSWYLCVAPACETVPLQHTGRLAKKLKPHRLMKVLHLHLESNLEDALNNATSGRYIFVKNAVGERVAYSVVEKNSLQPVIDYVVIKEHDDSRSNTIKSGVQAYFLYSSNSDAPNNSAPTLQAGIEVNAATENSMKDILSPSIATLVPVLQLRDIYAARYQSLASQHSGRIGLDFVNYKFPSA